MLNPKSTIPFKIVFRQFNSQITDDKQSRPLNLWSIEKYQSFSLMIHTPFTCLRVSKRITYSRSLFAFLKSWEWHSDSIVKAFVQALMTIVVWSLFLGRKSFGMIIRRFGLCVKHESIRKELWGCWLITPISFSFFRALHLVVHKRAHTHTHSASPWDCGDLGEIMTIGPMHWCKNFHSNLTRKHIQFQHYVY